MAIGRRAVLALTLGMCAACGSETRDAQPIGGGWYIEHVTVGRFASVTSPVNLRRRWGRGHFIVDEWIESYRFVAPDCVVYNRSTGNKPWFAVCEEQAPARLPAWVVSAKDEGVWGGPVTVAEGDRQVERVEMAPMTQVIALARQQPQYQTGWTSDAATPVGLEKTLVDRKP